MLCNMELPKGGGSLKKEIEIPLKGMIIGVPCWTPIWLPFEVLPADALSSAAEARGVLAGCQNCTSPTGVLPKVDGYGSKLNHKKTAGFSPCFHLLGFHWGYPFLTHTQMEPNWFEITYHQDEKHCSRAMGSCPLSSEVWGKDWDVSVYHPSRG